MRIQIHNVGTSQNTMDIISQPKF